MTEEYFPRGGKKPNVTYFKQSSNFLGAAEKGQGKKKKQKKRPENDDGYLSDEVVEEVDQSYKMCAAGIGKTTIKPGLNILGRVRRVLDTKLHVSLPSKMEGTVMACHISEPYNKLLEAYVNDERETVRDLDSMFRAGQYVALQVLEADPLMLSAMPQHVNGSRTEADLCKGDILQAAVASVEDHGYVMDVGVGGARAFLPKDQVHPDLELDTGALVWTCVRAPAAGGALALSAAAAALARALRRRRGALQPGAAVEFLVDKSLENGIEGRVFGDTTAYIQRFHADNVKGKKPKLGQKLRAHVLYVMPTRNAPFLTTRDVFSAPYPDLSEEVAYQEGDIIDDAQVVKIAQRSVHFRLGRGAGTMSLRRLEAHEDYSDEQLVAQSYPIGSTHRVRVLTYNLSDYIYHVSDEPAVLAERYFRFEQLAPGARAVGKVRSVAEKHLTVSIGRLTGLVMQTHISDAGIYVDPKKASTSALTKKYKVGQEVAVRVLACDPRRRALQLTLKPSLLAEGAEALASYAQAQPGKSYVGVVKVVKEYVLVGFFADVVAYVPRDQLARAPAPPAHAFHPGQIVHCTILTVDPENKKMLGSLITPPFWPAKKPPNAGKRKNDAEETDVPKKKRKPEDAAEETGVKKKKDNKDKKNNKANEVSEESDFIETDIHEDSDQILKPEDKGLIDLSDCNTPKLLRKRVVSLKKSIRCRFKRIERIDKKIANIEETGLTPKNKKFHTAMHQEKLVIEERAKKLMEAIETALEKLKDYGEEECRDPNYKEKQKKEKEEIRKLKAKLRGVTIKKVKPSELKNNKKDKSKETVTDEQKQDKTAKKGKNKKDKLKETVNNEQKEEEKPNKGKKKKEKNEKVDEERVDKSKEIQVVESLEPVLQVPSAKEFWSENADNLAQNVREESSSSSEDEDRELPKKKRKKLSAAEKDAKARAEEERVRELERRAADDSQPRSSEQFERALLANPDCSQLWVAYMAFHLQATEIEKARAVARRALNTISFREEGEKLNVWLAMLNFEHRFGTGESQQKTLEDALQMCDRFSVHCKLLDILVDTSKPQELGALVDLMLRKYKRDPQCYIRCGAACFRAGLVDKARHAMQKALAVLEKKEHVGVLVQFALQERARGSRERAEALFEQVLGVYPRRVDVCAAYADMLAAAGDVAQLRQLMERMTSQKLPARKIKVLYNKWVELEERAGNTEQAERVRERALQFIENAKF